MPRRLSIRFAVALLAATLAAASFADSAGRGRCAVKGGSCSHRHLSRGVFTNRDLTHSHWIRATLTHANFSGSNLFGASFRKARLQYANLTNGNRTQANFNGADMFGANLAHSTFWGTKMRYANLRYAHLNGTTMDNTDLTGANFRGADLRGASFYGAILCHTIQPNDKPNDQNCPGHGKGHGIHGSGVDLPQNFPTRGGPLNNDKQDNGQPSGR